MIKGAAAISPRRPAFYIIFLIIGAFLRELAHHSANAEDETEGVALS